jgi:hypothetical protein
MKLNIRKVIRMGLLSCGYASGLALAWTSFTILVVRRGDSFSAACGFGLALLIWQIVVCVDRSRHSPLVVQKCQEVVQIDPLAPQDRHVVNTNIADEEIKDATPRVLDFGYQIVTSK